MANNKFQIKRTTVSGRTPNTTNSGNTHFIDTGELALNLTDGKMFSSNGSVYFEVGSNLENIAITSNATFGSSGKIIANGAFGTDGQVLASNGTTMYWATGGGGSGTVTQVNTGNGLSGGPITTTGTLSVVANNGLASNSTGVFVVAGTGVTSNATGVHIGQAVGTTDNVIFNDVTINGNTSIGNNTSDLVSFIASVNTSLLPAANNNQLGNSTQRWVLSANTIDASGLITGGDGATITGQVNASTGFGSGTINATSNGLFANATTILLGNSSVNVAISTSGITAKTGSFDGAVSGITTLAAGNTTITGFVNATSTIQGGSSLTIAGAASGITTLAAGNTTVTGFANVSTSVNSALLTVGTSFIANTTGAYHTGTVNAASHTTSGFVANTTAIVPTSNTILLGNSIGRFVLSANTGSFSGEVSGITTLAAGNTTITGFVNATSTIQGGSSLTIAGAASGITTLAAGNTTITGFANVSSDIFAGGAVTSDQFRLTQNVLGNVSGATTIDLLNGSYVTATATGAVTWTVTNATSPAQGFIIKLTNGGVGTQTWMSGTKFADNTAPTLTASGVDILTFITDDSGSTFKGVLSIANCS